MSKITLCSILLLSVTSCRISSLYPVAGAGAGGAAGSLGGPVTAGFGAIAGASVGEVLKAQDQPKDSAFKPEQYKELLNLVNSASGEQKGFVQKIEEGIYNILKIIGMLILLLVGGAMIYTRLKCHKTLKLLGISNENLGGIQRGSK